MLRITLDQKSDLARLKLDGKIIGPWVNELKVSWSDLKKSNPGQPVVVDLTDVTFVDADGRDLLRSLFRQGASLESRSLVTRFIIDRIQQESNGSGTTRDRG